MACPSQHVAVIGGGIVGSSIALNLAKKGCKVTLLDASPHAASAASGESWAWLNANRKVPEHYRDLNISGMEVWRSLGALAQFPGTLLLGDARPENEAYPSDQILHDSLELLEPGLSSRAAAKGARLYQQEGFGYCPAASQAFVEEAAGLGADVRFSEAVTDFQMEKSAAGPARVADSGIGYRITDPASGQPWVCGICPSESGRSSAEAVTASGRIQADTYVIAAGLGTPGLARKAGIEVPLAHKPATLNVYTAPAPPLLRHMLLSETLYLRQARDGSILISVYQDAETEKLHVPGDVASRPEESLRVGTQVQEWAAAIVPELANVGLDRVSLTSYPYPRDGHPIIGFTEAASNVYIAVMHSGATLGPLVGQLAAAEITGTASEEQLAMLKPYRLNRDFNTAQQAYTVGGAQKV